MPNERRLTAIRTSEVVAMVAAFVAYFCVYGFRKPFTAGTYDAAGAWGLGFKELIVLTQVAGYTLSKFAGICVVAEMPPRHRIAALLGLVSLAEAGLVAFGLLPRPWAALDGPASKTIAARNSPIEYSGPEVPPTARRSVADSARSVAAVSCSG